MINDILSHITRMIFILFIQVFILNNINLGGYINPYLYVIIILLLPINLPGWLTLVFGFFVGFTVDVFSQTIGLHTIATLSLAYVRVLTLRVLSPREGYEFNQESTLGGMGFGWFAYYAGFLTFIHHFILFSIEIGRISDFGFILGKTILSFLATSALVMLQQFLTLKRKGNG